MIDYGLVREAARPVLAEFAKKKNVAVALNAITAADIQEAKTKAKGSKTFAPPALLLAPVPDAQPAPTPALMGSM